MKHLKTYKIFESLVDKKIQLLKDLSIDLQDAGLQVEVINGSHSYLLRDPRISIHTGSRYTDDFKKFIIMRITDDDNKFNADLYFTDTIQDFIETLKSYGMNPRSMSGGNHFAVLKFDKHGHMTNSPIVRESAKTEIMKHKYSKEVLDECDSIIADIEDMVLEIKDAGLFTTVGYTPMTLACREESPKILVSIDGDTESFNSNLEEIKMSMDRIREYVKKLGFSSGSGEWERDNRKTYQILIQK